MSKLTIPSHHQSHRFSTIAMGFIFCCFFISSAFGQTPINTSKPVGMTAGAAGTNGTGAATYAIPIDIPAGVKGIQPRVSVSYSSQGAGNGYSGHGWTLAPLSMITRAGKNVFQNGISTPVDYTGANDAFVMDGQRLMLVSGTNGASGSTYGTEQESFSKVEAMGGNGDSPDWFKVTTKNGTLLEYGTNYSKLKTNDGTNVIFWMLRKVTDASGNYMLYNYNIDNSNRYYSLSSITYTGNTSTQPSYKVMFTYSAKTDFQSNPLYISGSSVYSARILDRIDVKKTNDTQIRSYEFEYQYRQKKYFLTSVTEAGADGTALNPVTFTYGENTSAADVFLSGEHGYATDRNYTGDFDGDGRTDVQTYAYRLDPNNGETWYKWYQIYDYDANSNSIGEKYLYRIEDSIPNADVKVMGKDAVQNPFSVSDFDGDGKEDVLLAKFDKSFNLFKGININYSRVKQGFGGIKYTDYKKMAYDNLPGSAYGQHRVWKSGGSFFVSGDFDGDGHLDYILILGMPEKYILGIPFGSKNFKAFLSTPSKNIFNEEIAGFGEGVNGASGEFAAEAIAESKAIIPINFDGDGKTELLVVRDEGSYVISVFPVPPSSGSNYGSSVLYFTPDIKTDYKIFPADFNGDGNTDLFVRPSKDDAYTEWKIFLSTGKGFTKSTFPWAYTIILPGDGWSNSHMISIGDYDGDGKSDIWHSLDITMSSSRHVVYYSNGTSFTHETNDLSQSTNTEFMYSGGDFNGDGKPDLLKGRIVSNDNFPVKFLLAKPFKEENLLVGASNLGSLTSFDYALLNGKDNSNPAVYSRTEGEYSYNDTYDPAPHIPDYMVPAPPMYVLANIKRPNGLGSRTNQRFTYQDLILHTEGRGFLGFKLTDVTNDMNIVNRTWQEVNTEYSMMVPDVSQVHLKTGGMFTRSRYTTSFKQVSVSSYNNRRFFMKTDRVHTKNWLTNAAEETLNTYDDDGNITQTTVNKGTSNDFNITNTLETATATTAYGTYAGAPYPGFPTTTTVQKTRTGRPQVSKTTNYTYTAQGLPETVTENAGTAIATTVTTTYNGFGLPTQVTTSAPGITTPVINYVYDTKGQFVLEKKITGGGITKKETATYDDRWQAPLSKTSTDGLTTTFQYDIFGVLKQTNFPDGNSVTSTKSWETNNGNARFSILTKRTDGSSPVKVYVDILGREIKTEERAYVNKWLTSTKVYNSYGQLYQETVPYYSGETVNTTTYYYDSYGRPTSTTNTTGTITTTYDKSDGTTFTVKTKNALNQWTSKTSDASGKVISSSDNGVDMSFTYDSWGNQLTAGSNGQTFVTNAYDSYGRKQSTTDVNAGTISYEYNSIGQPTKQTDAKSQIQTTAYDVFGRVASTTGTQGTTTYTYYYDAGTQKSNDNVTQITGFNGDVRNYQYDNLQRLSSESMTTGTTTLSKSYTYDAHGNLETTTYPAGFTIRKDYNDDDLWLFTKYEIGGSSSYLYVTMGMNSRGVPTGYLIRNKYSNIEYDFSKEVITRYYTSGLMDLNLVYQTNTMNLLSRNDAIRNLTETFTYDVNDRLTSAKVNGVQQFAMSYDAGAQGKIVQKTDIGNYNYDAQKIHQLKYLTPISGGTDPSTVIGTNERNISYTPFLKTKTITENGYELTYTYGSDQQRLTSTLKHNGITVETKTYWQNMEMVTKNGVTSEIYYIAGPAGLTNIIVKKNGVIDTYNAYTDQLGSILAVTDAYGSVIAEQNFDSWGRYRNPADWSYTNVPANPDWLYRGFTSHEHLSVFALINMNGRMYDPVTGMMMSPDNYVPMPWSPGGYNRYNYAYGNPLKFTDPNGEWFGIDDLVVSTIGFVTGYVSHGISTGDWGWDAIKAGGTTAVASWLGYNTAGAATAFLKTGLSSGVSTVIGQGIGSAAGSAVGNVSSQLIFNHSLNWSELGKSTLFGFGSGIGTGLFDQSGLLTKHFPMSHTAKYLMRSTAGELAGGLATGGDFSNMTFGLNIGLALPLASDIATFATSRLSPKLVKKLAQKSLDDHKDLLDAKYNAEVGVSIDYGVYISPDAYSSDDYYIFLNDTDGYWYSETGIYATVKVSSGGFSINRIGPVIPKGFSFSNLSGIKFRIPIYKLPFTTATSINFSGIYSNMYRYSKR